MGVLKTYFIGGQKEVNEFSKNEDKYLRYLVLDTAYIFAGVGVSCAALFMASIFRDPSYLPLLIPYAIDAAPRIINSSRRAEKGEIKVNFAPGIIGTLRDVRASGLEKTVQP